MRGTKAIIASAGLTLAMSNVATAENLVKGTFAPEQLFTAFSNVAIFPTGSFFQTITLAAPGTVMISFSAVCSNTGGSNVFTVVQLLIDGVRIYPTNQTGNALCAGAGNALATDAIGTYTFVTTANLSAGNHTVTMKAGPSLAGQTSRLRNVALTAWN